MPSKGRKLPCIRPNSSPLTALAATGGDRRAGPSVTVKVDNINIQTPSADPAVHGKLVADHLENQVRQAIATMMMACRVRGELMAASSAQDVVGVFNSDGDQLFDGARAIRALVNPVARLMKQPLETGASIVDHIVFDPIQIQLSVILDAADPNDTYQQILNVFTAAQSVTVLTKTSSYPNMVIVGPPYDEVPEMSDTIAVGLKLEQANFVTAQYAALPASMVAKPSNASRPKRGKDASGRHRPATKCALQSHLWFAAMMLIPLQSLPKQNLSIVLGGNLFDLNVILTQNVMSMDIVSETAGVNVLGQRCLAGQLVIPFQSMEMGAGNFMFLTADDELPDYEQFNGTQLLFWASNDELAAVRPSPAAILSLFQTHATIAGSSTLKGVGRDGP